MLWTELDGQVMLMNVESGAYFELVGVGGDIWRLLESESDEGAIAEKLVERFDVDREKCLEDVRAFLSKLLATNIVIKSQGGEISSVRPQT